ncbi:MAG: di-heme oxidoredictase family protein, partial [Myxococcota bacterium]
ACHVPALDGPRGFVPALSDLLLHDMGPELADGFAFGEASGSEFRTQPLWGVGAVGPYLHDGRADTLAEAIRWHGGEAAASRARFDALSDAERGDVLAFLRSLGGEAQHTDGLVPPDADLEAIPPSRALSADEAARYLEGRALFDQDTFGSEGLGPRFNGDSCRACHFEPIVGGAGPGGVDVIRHGMVDGDAFVAPDFGTIAHRFEMAPVRPRFDARANLVERRQTPSLLGLGLLEAIPEAAILAGEDPLDADEDGIAGVAHRLPDGRLGRFGWKADVPSLHEFVRDALGAELGVTVPPEDGQSFGAASDDDGVPDPEFDVDQIESMRFFLATLGAPGGAPDVAGETLFADTGCADCHRTLEGPDGPVRAFTDLLLHDVQGDAFVGVPSANAGGRLFRTAPLWGIAGTAPYWHDGRASTLEDAIAAHEGTASAARQAFEVLSAEARERLLNFLSAL